MPVILFVRYLYVPVGLPLVSLARVFDVDLDLLLVSFAVAPVGGTNKFLDYSIPVVVAIRTKCCGRLGPAVVGHLPLNQRVIATKPFIDSLVDEAELTMLVFQALAARESGVVVRLLKIGAHGPNPKDKRQN